MNWTSPDRMMSIQKEQGGELDHLPRIVDMTQLILSLRALRISVRSRSRTRVVKIR